jgi:hypothetical protein
VDTDPSTDDEIYLTNSSGSDLAWSPDGRKIAFARPAFNEWNDWLIWVINKDGTGRKKITGVLNHYSPDWQPIVP